MLADAVLAGVHGGVKGGVNIFPKLCVKLYEAAESADMARVRDLHALMMRVSEKLYRIGEHSSAGSRGIMGALAVSGICEYFMAEPFQSFREPERERIRHILAEPNPLLKSL
jgi:dihydrodipicolinate synthase/N-acetylneuraminate lyase